MWDLIVSVPDHYLIFLLWFPCVGIESRDPVTVYLGISKRSPVTGEGLCDRPESY